MPIRSSDSRFSVIQIICAKLHRSTIQYKIVYLQQRTSLTLYNNNVYSQLGYTMTGKVLDSRRIIISWSALKVR